jgi:acyl carrier protein
MQVFYSRQEVLDRLNRIVAEKLGCPAASLDPEVHFTKKLRADSLDIYEMMMEIEKEFDITIADEDIVELQTTGALAEYIEANGFKHIQQQHLNLK